MVPGDLKHKHRISSHTHPSSLKLHLALEGGRRGALNNCSGPILKSAPIHPGCYPANFVLGLWALPIVVQRHGEVCETLVENPIKHISKEINFLYDGG